MEPDVIVETVDAAVDYDPSEATDQAFMVGFTEKGPTTPRRTFSLKQWEGLYGGPVENSILHKEAMLFFKEVGPGAALVTIRRTGPNPVHASSTAKNAVPADVIKIEANDVGAFGNTLTRQFVAGAVSGVQLIIVRSGVTLFHSGDLTTQAAIVAFCAATGVVTASALAGAGLPVVDGAPVALAGGTDDAVHSTDADRKAALEKLDVRLGPGQVYAPGDTTEAAHDQLREHHIAFDRIALLDQPDSPSAATLVGNVLPQRVKEGANGVAAFAPWVVTPDGTQLAPSGFVAAKIAKMDLATGNPNLPAAGVNGAADWITGLTQDFTVADRSALDAGAVNAIYDTDGVGNIQVYDYDTVVDPTVDPDTTALSNARLDMLIRWKARAIGRVLIMQEIDALGHLASNYAGRLDGMLKPFKGDGTIYDFVVDTASVNSRETAAEKRLNAKIRVQRTQYSKWVTLEVTNHAITEAI
jgi:hypothetical protein